MGYLIPKLRHNDDAQFQVFHVHIGPVLRACNRRVDLCSGCSGRAIFAYYIIDIQKWMLKLRISYTKYS